ncbi:response regulator transcription factor [Actinomadura macrotermitis]|uniref:response regulator transcription factor n=1 Tax=Actinomadura macrotermitis TaxID=2585200 RepID=UPI0018866576|nr:LuxR C-terminal-related transcriptional regulator [Actinomadura macrotermitis]
MSLPGSQAIWTEHVGRVHLLSTREVQVFTKLGEGYSNRLIARQFGIAERTVKTHVAQIMSKLGVDSRLQAGLVSVLHRLLNEGAIDDGCR